MNCRCGHCSLPQRHMANESAVESALLALDAKREALVQSEAWQMTLNFTAQGANDHENVGYIILVNAG